MKTLSLVIALLLASTGRAQSVPAGFNTQALEAKAAALFNASALIGTGTQLRTTADDVLICAQAVSTVLIVAGLIIRLQREQNQMEGVAATLIKVAFIALLPVCRDAAITSSDGIASLVGYQSVTANGTSSPVMTDMWKLVGQWTPPGTPYLDALEAQNGENAPTSGGEQAWGLQAWNWARGVGTADATMFHALWQAASGSLRAAIVFACSSLMVCCLSFTITLSYFGEILRYVLFFGGCSLAPMAIAGLSIDGLKAPCMKFILGVFTIALWPVAWALGNIVTHGMARGADEWITSITTRALAAANLPASSLGVAAPYLAWGILFLFVGVTLALCVWMLASIFYAPVLLGRAVSATAGVVGSAIVANTEVRQPTNTTSIMKAPVAAAARTQTPRAPETALPLTVRRRTSGSSSATRQSMTPLSSVSISRRGDLSRARPRRVAQR